MPKSYLEFTFIKKLPKTSLWAVGTKVGLFILGIIRWYGPWHQYCFFPEPKMVFSKEYLSEITEFINSIKK
jgi:hypothetical protein